MATLWIAGVDIADTLPGVQFTGLPDHLNRPRAEIPRVDIPGRAGGVRAGPARIGTRVFHTPCYLAAEDTAGARTLLDTVNSLCGVGDAVTVRIADRTDREISAHLLDIRAEAYQPELLSPWIRCDIVWEALDPYWTDTAATVTNLSGTLAPIPCGTAPHGGVIQINGAVTPVVNPVVAYADSAGVTIASSTFTVSLASGDWLKIDTALKTITSYLSAVEAQNDALLTAGLFPGKIDPRDGNWRDSEYPQLQLTASSGTPTGTFTHRRGWA